VLAIAPEEVRRGVAFRLLVGPGWQSHDEDEQSGWQPAA
jgi:hypothetical protein